MNIKVFKLTSGEEVIAELDNKVQLEDGARYSLKNPLLIALTPQGLAMMGFMPYVDPDSKIEIHEDNVMIVADPINDLANNYRSKFSGIVLPEKKIDTSGLKIDI